MTLQELGFVLIAVVWTGYFVLEGFDFGIGMGIWLIARSDAERRVLINTVGPVWDGNEVWLLTAGGATFAAFPQWYASLFSGFYLPRIPSYGSSSRRTTSLRSLPSVRQEGAQGTRCSSPSITVIPSRLTWTGRSRPWTGRLGATRGRRRRSGSPTSCRSSARLRTAAAHCRHSVSPGRCPRTGYRSLPGMTCSACPSTRRYSSSSP